ncbi:MAG TPA: YceI family protein [Chitinophagaceae bacterium]|nr:YceI family protein [Chitinophagaceae bacterium]
MTTNKWSLDQTHSEIHFKVKHMMISTVTGQFSKFSSSVETVGDDFRTAKIQFTADVDSISTNNEQRDAHLKNGDFFDVPNYPHITFRSTNIAKVDDENYKVHGELTMRGVTKNIILDVEFGGIMQDPWGNTRAGFTIAGKINRQDYAISFGGVTETGGLLLSDEVKISANAEFVKESALVEA